MGYFDECEWPFANRDNLRCGGSVRPGSRVINFSHNFG